ncbi:MAG: DUF5320 domain-containing protein [Chloroflexota bacterium]|nr:DUF5320 domain-containing protein [Chloroflexota bacterium]
MPGFDGTGPRGMGPMTGGGRGFCSPWGLGRGMPYPVAGQQPGYGAPYGYPYGSMSYAGAMPYTGASPYNLSMTREDELGFLESQAQSLKGQLEQIDGRIMELEKEKK